jgi:chaperone protein EcpD
MSTLSIRHTVAALCAMLVALSAQASVVISSTRIIYPQSHKEVTVRLESRNQVPVLIQTWLDNGDEHSTPELADIPFVVTPPIFRMEPGKQQVVRVAYTGEGLPQAQESLFWFNVLEVPAQARGVQPSNQLQLAFRTRIKLILRPPVLPHGAEAAPAKLQWRRVSSGYGEAVEVFNPTPYLVTFERVEVQVAGQRHGRQAAASGAGNMVMPGARTRFDLPDLKAPPGATASVEFQTLDDFGVKVLHNAKVAP